MRVNRNGFRSHGYPHIDRDANEGLVLMERTDADKLRTRRSVLLGMAIGALVSLFGVGWYWIASDDTPEDSPRIATGRYMNAVKKRDADTARELLCHKLSHQRELPALQLKFSKLEYAIEKAEKVSKDKYQVAVHVDLVVDSSGSPSSINTNYLFNVVKEDDHWRVCGTS